MLRPLSRPMAEKIRTAAATEAPEEKNTMAVPTGMNMEGMVQVLTAVMRRTSAGKVDSICMISATAGSDSLYRLF